MTAVMCMLDIDGECRISDAAKELRDASDCEGGDSTACVTKISAEASQHAFDRASGDGTSCVTSFDAEANQHASNHASGGGTSCVTSFDAEANQYASNRASGDGTSSVASIDTEAGQHASDRASGEFKHMHSTEAHETSPIGAHTARAPNASHAAQKSFAESADLDANIADAPGCGADGLWTLAAVSKRERGALGNMPCDARGLLLYQIRLISLRETRAMQDMRALDMRRGDALEECVHKIACVSGKAGPDSSQDTDEVTTKRRAIFDARQEIQSLLTRLGEQKLKALEMLGELEERGGNDMSTAAPCIVIPDNGRARIEEGGSTHGG